MSTFADFTNHPAQTADSKASFDALSAKMSAEHAVAMGSFVNWLLNMGQSLPAIIAAIEANWALIEKVLQGNGSGADFFMLLQLLIGLVLKPATPASQSVPSYHACYDPTEDDAKVAAAKAKIAEDKAKLLEVPAAVPPPVQPNVNVTPAQPSVTVTRVA
jgi:hypothetical protein